MNNIFLLSLRRFFLSALCLLLVPTLIAQSEVDLSSWTNIVKNAAGKKVYFHAWSGSPTINAYIADAGKRLFENYGVELVHVKINDIAESVGLIRSEQIAGNRQKGKVDLVWINGENFYTMRKFDLLFGPFLEALPNLAKIDQQNPAIQNDFTIPIDGLEAPWGKSSFVFIYNPKNLAQPPKSAQMFLTTAKKHPGRLTYPAPPDFTGVTFLKQMLYELVADPEVLLQPVVPANYAQQTAAFWQWLEELHPYLWRKGENFPKNPIDQRTLMQQNQVDINYSFAPLSTSSDIQRGDLPDFIRTYVPDKGTIQNTHYLAIPFNSAEKAAALVVINHFLSEGEQFEKLIPKNWGDLPVLDLAKISADWQKKFGSLDLGVASLPPNELAPGLSEPHPSWVQKIEEDWAKRFAQ